MFDKGVLRLYRYIDEEGIVEVQQFTFDLMKEYSLNYQRVINDRR
jgi:hypothetical protein